MRPSTFLLILLCLASLAGALLYSSHQRQALQADYEKRLTSLKSGGPGATLPPGMEAAGSEVEAMQKTVSFLQDQNRLLTEENDKLNKAMQQMSAGKSGTTPPPAHVVPTPSTLAKEVEAIRELKYKNTPEFTRVTLDEIEKRQRDVLAKRFPEDKARARERAARAVGYVWDPQYKLVDALTGLTMEQSGGIYDAATNTLALDKEADFEARPDLKGRFVLELARVLAAQNFDLTKLPLADDTNDDATLAVAALVIGDAVTAKIQYGVADMLNNDYSRAQQPAAAAFYAAPIFLRERFLFPYMMGDYFAQTIHQQSGFKSLDAAYARPPQSSTEILHPELYQATPPFQPAAVALPSAPVNGQAPLFENVLGEFGTLLLLKSQTREEVALQASDGWQGDRYVVYPGDEKKGDHAVWRSVWRTEVDAKDFAAAIRTMLLHRYAVPESPAQTLADGSFAVNDAARVIRIRTAVDKKTVTVINATDTAFADALEAAVNK